MEKLEKLKKEREELDKKIETLEYAERIFEEGDEIYYVDQFGIVNCGKWDNFAWIDAAFSQGHIFRTKQAAELESKRRNLLTRFKAFRDECNGDWEKDWKNHRNRKYFISFETTGMSAMGTGRRIGVIVMKNGKLITTQKTKSLKHFGLL